MNNIINKLKNKKGFTLVELTIVIIILAILSGVSIPSFIKIKERSKESGTKSEMRSMANAIGLYNSDNEYYPIASDVSSLSPAINTYLSSPPTRDLWGFDYDYNSPDGSFYIFKSAGIDNSLNTSDDIVIKNGIMSVGKPYDYINIETTFITSKITPASITRGSNATISIRTSPNTKCSLRFILPSGAASGATGIKPGIEGQGIKTSDSEGSLSWTWLVSGNTGTGTGQIEITIEGQDPFMQDFTIYKADGTL